MSSDWQTVSPPPAHDEWQTVSAPPAPPHLQHPTPPLLPAAKAAGSAIGSAFGNLMDVLGGPQRVNASRVSHAASNPRGVLRAVTFPFDPTAILDPAARKQMGDDVYALFHPGDPHVEDAATAAMMGTTPEHFAKLPGVRRGANTFAQELVTDPLTYLGSTGILKHAVEEAGAHVLPAAYRAASSVAKKTAGTAIHDAFDLTSRAAGWLHDQVTPGGRPVAHAIRELARTRGAEGMRQAERMTSAASGSQSVAAHIAATGKQLLDETLRNVAPAAQSAIFKAIHGGTIASLPEALRPIADRLVQIDRSIPWLLGTKSVRTWLQKRGFILPHELQVFDQGPRGVVTIKNVREHHVPLPHELTPEERDVAFQNLKRTGGRRGLSDTDSPFFERRAGEPDEQLFDDPDLIREVWARSFASAGKALGGAKLRSDLVRIFAQTPQERVAFLESLHDRLHHGDLARRPMTISDVFDTALHRESSSAAYQRAVPSAVRAAYGPREAAEETPAQELIRFAEKLGNLGKSTLFTTPFPHQRNIATLLTLADPGALPAAIGNYARLGAGFAKPSRKAAVLGRAMRAGATGMPNLEQSGLMDLLESPTLRKVVGPLGHAASRWYGGVGKMLWGWDDAVKKALFDRELRRFGGDEGRAAASVRRKMVDYSNTSPFQEAARLIAPFATYRTAMPAAVLRSLAEHPEYALALARATGGAIAGKPFKGASGKPYQLSGPLADVSELLSADAGKYVRNSTSLTSKIALDALAKILRQKELPFSSKQIESNIPIFGMLANPYNDSLGDRAQFNLTGAHPYVEPRHARHRSHHRRRRRPSFDEMLAP